MSPDASEAPEQATAGVPDASAGHAGDATDRYRMRVARTLLAAIVGGGLWIMLGIQWAQRWCRDCEAGAATLGLAVAWGAVAAVVAGRLAWQPDVPRRLAGLALLVWTAVAVTWPAATGPILAGPVLLGLLGFHFATGFLLHWSLVAAVHLGLLFWLESALRVRMAS